MGKEKFAAFWRLVFDRVHHHVPRIWSCVLARHSNARKRRHSLLRPDLHVCTVSKRPPCFSASNRSGCFYLSLSAPSISPCWRPTLLSLPEPLRPLRRYSSS